jgi:hypothetical protein
MDGFDAVTKHIEYKRPTNDPATGTSSPESTYLEEHNLKNGTLGRAHLPPTIPPHAQQEHGALIDHKAHPQDEEVESRPDLWWSKVRHICQDAFSEFFGVFILILFGDGVVAQVVLSSDQKGDYQSISWG